jgi:hypothetical protein
MQTLYFLRVPDSYVMGLIRGTRSFLLVHYTTVIPGYASFPINGVSSGQSNEVRGPLSRLYQWRSVGPEGGLATEGGHESRPFPAPSEP